MANNSASPSFDDVSTKAEELLKAFRGLKDGKKFEPLAKPIKLAKAVISHLDFLGAKFTKNRDVDLKKLHDHLQSLTGDLCKLAQNKDAEIDPTNTLLSVLKSTLSLAEDDGVKKDTANYIGQLNQAIKVLEGLDDGIETNAHYGSGDMFNSNGGKQYNNTANGSQYNAESQTFEGERRRK